MSEFEINTDLCRGRQRRLLDEMATLGLESVIVTQRAHVQWLTGCWFPWLFEPCAALDSAGQCVLVAPSRRMPEAAAADNVVPFEAQWLSTLRNDQRAASSAELLKALPKKPRRLGVEFSSSSPHITLGLDAELVDIEPILLRLRRRKDADELALIEKAIAGTRAMYARAREIVEPGVCELEVFNQLQAAAVEEFGEMLTGTGNDYACNQRGGPPRRRARRPASCISSI